MALETIITKVKTILEGVSGIGKVYNIEKFITTETKFKSDFVASGKVNGWHITRRGCREEIDAMGRNTRWHRILITGFYGLKDSTASEVTFRTLVENIISALRSNNTLDGALDDGEQCLPPQLITSRPGQVFKILCHKAEIELEVQEIETYSYS